MVWYNFDMKTARLFKEGTIVDAYDVFDGKVSKNNDFVDVEEDFRVYYCKGAKNHGRAHFKLYYARDEYLSWAEEKRTRYDILSKQRHYQESKWHREWEAAFKEYAEIEKTIINEETKKRKRADAYIDRLKLCLEFQHSFINYDFEERNTFYSDLGIKTVWVYDLSSQNVKKKDGNYMILENNAKGFFRIAENPDNLKNNNVFIQAKDKQLYLIKELGRKQIDNEKKSTVRTFEPECIISKDEFVNSIINGDLSFLREKELDMFSSFFEGLNNESISENNYVNYAKPKMLSVLELWDPKYYFMVLYNPLKKKYIRIEKDPQKKGDMERSEQWNHILYQEIEWNPRTRQYFVKDDTKKKLSWEEEKEKCWLLKRGYRDKAYRRY